MTDTTFNFDFVAMASQILALDHNEAIAVAHTATNALDQNGGDPSAAIEHLAARVTGDYYLMPHQKVQCCRAASLLGAFHVLEKLATIADDRDIEIKRCHDCNGIHDMPGDRCPICAK